MAKPLHSITSLFSLAVLGCAPEVDVAAYYSHTDCSPLEIVDETTAWRLRGIEDIVLDEARSRLYLSAYDRRSVESAARSRRNDIPTGGIYAIHLDQLTVETEKPVMATALVAGAAITGGVRPHGLDYDQQADEILFINRVYEKKGRQWKMSPKLQRVGANGEAFVGTVPVIKCAANDVIATENGVLTSFDHAFCDWRGWAENIFALRWSGVTDGAVTHATSGFANGVVRLPNGDIALAATRENAVKILRRQGDGFLEIGRIDLPGAPDNLTYDGKRIIAALHPSILRLTLNRKFGIGFAPSRIVSIDTASGTHKTLFDDSNGELFSAATVAVGTDEGLILGSVTDRGLLHCRKPA